MDFITPNWDVPATVRAICTTRKGGVSRGVYSGMNLAAHVGDVPEHVARNRVRLNAELSLLGEPVWLNQVHGTELIDAGLAAPSVSAPLTADGSWTQNTGVVCAVLTADCMPVLMSSKEGDRVAAVHAGWRGLADGILERAVKQFSQASDVRVWIGPCIGPQAFEVGMEVREALAGPDSAYTPSNNAGRLMANLPLLAQHRLAELGVTRFFNSAQCTYSDSKRYFSYRRDGQCGRMASLIWIDNALV